MENAPKVSTKELGAVACDDNKNGIYEEKSGMGLLRCLVYIYRSSLLAKLAVSLHTEHTHMLILNSGFFSPIETFLGENFLDAVKTEAVGENFATCARLLRCDNSKVPCQTFPWLKNAAFRNSHLSS